MIQFYRFFALSAAAFGLYALHGCQQPAANAAPKSETAPTAANPAPDSATNAPAAQPAPIETANDTISIIGTGDIMMGSNYPSASSLPPNDGKEVFSHVKPYLEDATLTFGNVEGVLLDKGGTPKACGDSRYCYTFRMPTMYADRFKEAGFDFMSVANNHASDFGDGGRQSTAEALRRVGIHFAGSIENPTTSFVKDGVKYGFAAFAPNRGCMDMKDYKGAAEIVRKLAAENDIVIVSFHGGAEGVAHRHVPCKDEIFLGANRGNVCTFARTCIDAGADVLFGHGPHVTRGVELYKDRFIIYSMSNFCTYEKFSIAGSKGLAPIMKVFVNKKGEFLKGQIIPVQQHGKGIPKYDPDHKVTKEIIELSAKDFPQSPLRIEADGGVYKK